MPSVPAQANIFPQFFLLAEFIYFICFLSICLYTFFHLILFHFLGFLYVPAQARIFSSCSYWSNASTSSVSPQLISSYLFTSISFTFLYFFYFSKENKAQKDSPKAELEYKLEGFIKMFWECESRTRGQNKSKINLIVCRANPPKRIWLYPCTSKHSAPVVPVVWVFVPCLFPLYVSLPFSCQSLSFPQTPLPLFFLLALCWSKPFFFRRDSLAHFYFEWLHVGQFIGLVVSLGPSPSDDQRLQSFAGCEVATLHFQPLVMNQWVK